MAAALALAAALPGTAPAAAAETLAGPIPAEVVEVIDGDTLDVRARIWLGQDVRIRVRLSGVDAPEIRGRCAAELDLAARARELVGAKVAAGPVILSEVRYGKFAGRVVARVRTADGEDLGRALIDAGLARAYDGGPRPPWCGD